ncbi:hypothetical protein Tco_1391508 [Tanacetum coccineum]
MGSIDDIKSILTQSALDALCEKFHIPHTVHPKPSRNNRIRNSPAGKIGIYTRFFDFANYHIPLSQFLVDVLDYFQINVSQLSVIAATKISHFEILCRVHIFVLTVGNFSRFYINSKNKGGRVVPLAGVNEQGNQNEVVQDVGAHVVNEESGDAAVADQIQAIVADEPKKTRKKRKATDGASGSNLPPKKLREYHDTSGDAGASTAGKSLIVLQDLLDRSTLAAEVGVTAAATVPFITSFVTPTLERGDGGPTDSVFDAEVTSLVRSSALLPPVMTTAVTTSHVVGVSSALILGVGAGPIIQSIFADYASPSAIGPDIVGPSDPAGTSVSSDNFYISQEIDFETLQQTYVPKWNVINDSALDDPEVCHKFNVGVARQACFSSKIRLRSKHNYRERKKFERKCTRQAGLLKEKDVEIANLRAQLFKGEGGDTLESLCLSFLESLNRSSFLKIFLLSHAGKTNVITAEKISALTYGFWVHFFNHMSVRRYVADPVNIFPERSIIKLILKEAVIFDVEAEAAEAIPLRGQVATVEAAETARVNELTGLKERNFTLEEENTVLENRVAALESTDAAKGTKLASLTAQTVKLTQDLSEMGLSCDELSIKASTLKAERDRLIGQVSALETTCSGLCDQVSGYELFKEQIGAVQDEHVKVLSDKVAVLDFELTGIALHLDEKFYPHFLTIIAGRRWIIGRGLRLVVMKCLQSLEYLAALGGAIGCAIDKGIQDGLATGIDHGKDGRDLINISFYDPFIEANYISAVNNLYTVDFPLLAQLATQKDANIADIMDLLHLEGPAAKTPEANQLQPSPKQLMLPIHRPEDQVIVGETSLSFSLDAVHARVRRIREEVASQRLSISDVMVPLIEPLFVENLVGEASTSGVPATVAATTALSTTFVQTSFVPPVPMLDSEVVDTGPQAGASSSSKIIFKQETLETTPEH